MQSPQTKRQYTPSRKSIIILRKINSLYFFPHKKEEEEIFSHVFHSFQIMEIKFRNGWTLSISIDNITNDTLKKKKRTKLTSVNKSLGPCFPCSHLILYPTFSCILREIQGATQNNRIQEQ